MSNACLCIWGRQARFEAGTSTTKWKGAGLIPVTDRPVLIAEVPLSKALHGTVSGARTLRHWSKCSERIFQTWFYTKWSIVLNKHHGTRLKNSLCLACLPWGSWQKQINILNAWFGSKHTLNGRWGGQWWVVTGYNYKVVQITFPTSVLHCGMTGASSEKYLQPFLTWTMQQKCSCSCSCTGLRKNFWLCYKYLLCKTKWKK